MVLFVKDFGLFVTNFRRFANLVVPGPAMSTSNFKRSVDLDVRHSSYLRGRHEVHAIDPALIAYASQSTYGRTRNGSD
jgi:hypothetical protein